jgi:uncharacterized integral membrane protein (TIGR00698 family)
MLGTLFVGLVGISFLGRALGINRPQTGLIAVGTSICGASAIAAIAPILEASSAEISYAVSTIFLFNLSAVVTFPLVAHALSFPTPAFALWAGTAVNDTSSVLAASFAFGAGAAATAAVVKLARTVMILPISVGIAIVSHDEAADGWRQRAMTVLRKGLPWFILGFLVAATLNTIGLIPATGVHGAQDAAQVLTVAALAAIGLGTDVRAIRRSSRRPLVLGLVGWLLVATTSLLLQRLTGTL